MGLEAAHAPAAVGAQLQVSVALVGALHQERDGFRLGLRLHVDGAPRQQGGSAPAASNSRNDGSSLGRAPPPPAPFIGTPRPGSLDRTLCGCRPLAEAEAPALTWPNRRPVPWAEGRAKACGRGLMQPAAVASPGVAAAAWAPGFGDHAGVRAARAGSVSPEDTGLLRGSGCSRPFREGRPCRLRVWQPLQIVSSQSSTPAPLPLVPLALSLPMGGPRRQAPRAGGAAPTLAAAQRTAGRTQFAAP